MAETNSFPVMQTNANLRETRYQMNRKAWDPVLEQFEEALRKTTSEGDERSQKRHQERGQLLG